MKVGEGWGFNGGKLLYLAVAGCVSNELFREARAEGIEIESVRVVVRGDFGGDPMVSGKITYEVELTGNAPPDELHKLAEKVDTVVEIPNSLRQGTPVTLANLRIVTKNEGDDLAMPGRGHA